MYLLDHITVNDFIIASMLADNSKEAQEKLASRLNNIFGDDVAEGFFEGEEFNELVQQTISLIPVWLENGSKKNKPVKKFQQKTPQDPKQAYKKT